MKAKRLLWWVKNYCSYLSGSGAKPVKSAGVLKRREEYMKQAAAQTAERKKGKEGG